VCAGPASSDVFGVGQPSQRGGHGGLHGELYLPHAVHHRPVRVHRHQAGDAPGSGDKKHW